MNVGTATVQDISRTESPATSHPNDVKFKVAYPENYQGAKHMKEGTIHTVSKESAEQFTKAGIGSIVTGEAEVETKQDPLNDGESAEQFTKAEGSADTSVSKQKSSSKKKVSK